MTVIDQLDYDTAKKFIADDIRREIELAKATHDPTRLTHLTQAGVPNGGGNFLAALGLLCFTEYCGWLKFDHQHPVGHRSAGKPISSKNFNGYFDYLGPSYAAFRAVPANDVYNLFRCGMAHNYFAKPNDYAIAMLRGGANMGIVLLAGRYEFVVEQYYIDLVASFTRLDHDLSGQFPLTRP